METFPSSPSTHTEMINEHEAGELGIPIGLAVDFADEIEMDMGAGGAVGANGNPPGLFSDENHAVNLSSPSSPVSSQSSSLPLSSPTVATSYMSTPPASPAPEQGPSWKGKGRAIPTGHAARQLDAIDPHAFQTPPDTSFGTPSGSDPSRGRTKTREEAEREDLPSIMPLSPSPSPSPTPRPSRVRAISGLSFSSLRETIAHRRHSRSGHASPSTESAPKRKLSLKGLKGIVRRGSAMLGSGLGSEVTSGASTPASSAFQTPSSSLPRRGLPETRPSVKNVWEEKEAVTRPVRGRADTAPGDYFGFRFDTETGDEPSREDVSAIIQMSPVEEVDDPTPLAPLNPFDTLPRELHLLVLAHLAESYVADYAREITNKTWSASRAANDQNKWFGHAAGLRAIVASARVSRAWYALAHDGTFWTQIRYGDMVPTRIAVPGLTSWLSPALRHEAKAPLQIEQLDAQDERVMRLVRTAGPCLSELDLRGFVRFGSGDVKRMMGWISTAVAASKVQPGASPVRSLLALTRFDTAPAPPTRTTNLSSLVLTSCVKLPTQALNTLLAASPHLVRLEMRALPAVTDETIAMVASRCRSLTWLDIGRCQNLGPRALPAICGTNSDGGLKHLRVLHMAGYPHIDPASLKALGQSLGHTLETLDLAGVWGMTDDCLAAYVDIEPSAAQVEMSRLAEIERWARARDGRVEALNVPVAFVSLTAREAGLDPTLHGPFYRRRTALRHLNLSDCRRLTDAGVGALAHAVPDLEVIQLAGIGAMMTHPGLVRLFRTTRRIRRVDLEDANITDDVLDALSPPMSEDVPDPADDDEDGESIQIAMRTDPCHPGHALTHLVLSHCTHITSRALAQLVRSCPRLRVLSLDGTPADDRVVRFFVYATRARGLEGAEVSATDTRFVARAGIPTTGVRPRAGTREWTTRGMGYVDSRDANATEVEDECDGRKVVVKTYWSWQAVDGVLERRKAMLSSSSRRNTDLGASGIRAGPRWGRHRQDERGGCVVM